MSKHSFLITSAILLFFILRIGFALTLPIFNDESIYLHWGQIFQHSANDAFFATELDGKPPGTSILFGILMILPFDPLLTIRFANILFSFISLLLLFSLIKKYDSEKLHSSYSDLQLVRAKKRIRWAYTEKLTNNSSLFGIAPLFLFLCATNPFLVLFDSLALQEPSITLLSTIMLMLTLSLMKTPTLLKGLGIGLTLGIGMWMKPNITIFLPGLLIGLTLMFIKHRKHMEKNILTISGIVASFLFLFLPLRLHPLYQMIEKKMTERAFTIPELFTFPFATWLPHTLSALSWYIGYGTIPIFLLALFGIAQSLRQEKFRFLFLWFILPIACSLLTAKMLTARYVVYGMPLFIFFSAYGISKLPKFQALVTAGTLGVSLLVSGILMISPLSYHRFLNFSPKTRSDFSQYVSGWSSGYGVGEAINFLKNEALRSPIVVTVRLDSGNPEDAVYLYGAHIENAVVGRINNLPTVLTRMREKNIIYPIYFVSRGDQHGFFKPCLNERKKFEKPLDSEYVGVYEINRVCAETLIAEAMKK